MIYRLTECEIDATRFELRRAGQAVPIEPQVLELLLYLVANRDRAVTRRELFDQLWRGRVVSDSALNSRIKAARSAIGDDGKAQSGIRTLHRTGYRFVGEVEEMAASVVAGVLPQAETPVPVVTRGPLAAPFMRGRVGVFRAVLGLVAAIGAFALLPHDTRDISLSAVA